MKNDLTITTQINESLNQFIITLNPDKIAILVDENTKKNCLSQLTISREFNVLEIKSGEKNKNIDTCVFLWRQLTALQFSKKSLLINLGGGVITDMGGFVASTFKRGFFFINIPTTLLAQVDASIGGKLGVDFDGLKNHIGVFNFPYHVLINSNFLKTLELRELRSGFAEVIKHALIYDNAYWQEIISSDFPNNIHWDKIIAQSIEIKKDIVTQDPKESGLRKILNFGHTLGHAIETWHLENNLSLLHGEAIAIGMVAEAYLSFQLKNLSKTELEQIVNFIFNIFEKRDFDIPENELMNLLQQDKKNANNALNFSLISQIGKCEYDCKVTLPEIRKAISFYKEY